MKKEKNICIGRNHQPRSRLTMHHRQKISIRRWLIRAEAEHRRRITSLCSTPMHPIPTIIRRRLIIKITLNNHSCQLHPQPQQPIPPHWTNSAITAEAAQFVPQLHPCSRLPDCAMFHKNTRARRIRPVSFSVMSRHCRWMTRLFLVLRFSVLWSVLC